MNSTPSSPVVPASLPIRSILIANRGEIARRIIKTCKALGIDTVAVYAPVDGKAPYVAEATHAIPLPSATAFLDAALLTQFAVDANVDAVHPGYGFLSENPGFVDALSAAGVRFIGPTANCMRAVGDKTKAKEIAAARGVPISPTLLLEGISENSLGAQIKKFGDEVGYPLMLKAAAGGGGRGMRVLDENTDILAAISSASREATRSFGKSALFVEKLISPARHIEVQILADTYGRVIAVGTRDCSLQRSNQKIIEEAPAPFLSTETSQAIMKSAVAMAEGAFYSNAGTVEFLLTPDERYYFLEVNSRLQVEHPVTEMVTGRDLVRDQIRIAEGSTLSSLDLVSSPCPTGHAIEARVCAEAFDDSLTISTGTISEFELPTDPLFGTVRYDFGCHAGSNISHDFDSLLGKVIAWGDTREEARATLICALSRANISGVRTNRSLLLHLLDTEAFRSGTLAVQSTAQLLPSRSKRKSEATEAAALVSGTELLAAFSQENAASPWYSHRGFSLGPSLTFPLQFRCHGFVFDIRGTVTCGECILSMENDGEIVTHSCAISRHQGLLRTPHSTLLLAEVVLDGRREQVRIEKPASPRESMWIHRASGSWEVVPEPRASLVQGENGGEALSQITSPLPGRIASVSAKVGDTVQQGFAVALLDSMKMEHPIRTPRAGIIKTVHVSVGQTVGTGMTVMTLE